MLSGKAEGGSSVPPAASAAAAAAAVAAVKAPVDRKAKIPKALREQVWMASIGAKYEAKCLVSWCTNRINVFDFHVGHNKPESKGGKLDIKNLQAICARCNLSMGNQYTIDEWNQLSSAHGCVGAFGCFGRF